MLNAYSDSSSYSSSCFALHCLFLLKRYFFWFCFFYLVCFLKRSTDCQNSFTETQRSLLFCNIILKIWYRDYYYARSRGSNCFGCSCTFHTFSFHTSLKEKNLISDTNTTRYFVQIFFLCLFRLIQIPTYYIPTVLARIYVCTFNYKNKHLK